MKFMLLMYSLPEEWPDAPQSDRNEVMEKHAGLRNELSASGELLSGAGLVDPSKTMTLRWNGGSPTRTDGPITDADPPLTAYYVLDCDTIQRAISIAERILDFHVVAIELREIHDSTGFDVGDSPGD